MTTSRLLKRLGRHLFTPPWAVRRAFAPATMAAVTAAIAAAEMRHRGEIRIAIEGALEPADVLRGQTPRQRALDVFSLLRVWDTEHNNGVLVYVLLADHAVEIVADRGLNAAAGEAAWQAVCQQMETAFAQGAYQAGAVQGIDALAQTLQRHYPRDARQPPGRNELPDAPVLL